MTADAGEVFNELIAEYDTAQKVREHADSPTPHCVGQFWMNDGKLHISGLGPDGATIIWIPVSMRGDDEEDGPSPLWVYKVFRSTVGLSVKSLYHIPVKALGSYVHLHTQRKGSHQRRGSSAR